MAANQRGDGIHADSRIGLLLYFVFMDSLCDPCKQQTVCLDGGRGGNETTQWEYV